MHDDLVAELLGKQLREALHRLEVAGAAVQQEDADLLAVGAARDLAADWARRRGRRCPSPGRALGCGRHPRAPRREPRAWRAHRRCRAAHPRAAWWRAASKRRQALRSTNLLSTSSLLFLRQHDGSAGRGGEHHGPARRRVGVATQHRLHQHVCAHHLGLDRRSGEHGERQPPLEHVIARRRGAGSLDDLEVLGTDTDHDVLPGASASSAHSSDEPPAVGVDKRMTRLRSLADNFVAGQQIARAQKPRREDVRGRRRSRQAGPRSMIRPSFITMIQSEIASASA